MIFDKEEDLFEKEYLKYVDKVVTNWGNDFKKLKFPDFKVIKPIDDGKIIFKFALPGVTKEDISIELHPNFVEVSCEKDTEFVGSFKHAVSFNGYDKDSLKHSFENGVLVLEFEKKEEFKPKKIKL